ncbi:MAG: HU family DNA-binding protein [Bacteroides xylanisolvens]
MNKKELIRAISQETNSPVSQAKVAMILDTAITVIRRTLATGESVKWAGFGSFVVKDIPSKRLYSPSLKKYIETKGVQKVVFVEPRRRK